MTEQEVANYWNENAPGWTMLARAGYDMYRNHFNTPAFLSILPDINGLTGIDIGCGEGYNTRLVAQRCTYMEAIDIAPYFIEHATMTEPGNPANIHYQVASATQLPFPNEQFDFATSFMCLMDIPDPQKALIEAYRVLKPGGFFQFSIEHPCFKTPHIKKIRNNNGKTMAYEVGDYFAASNGKISEWIFGNTPVELKETTPKFIIPVFHQTLTYWMNAILRAGFVLEQLNEPRPSDATVQQWPFLHAAQVVSHFLHIRCRKPLITR